MLFDAVNGIKMTKNDPPEDDQVYLVKKSHNCHNTVICQKTFRTCSEYDCARNDRYVFLSFTLIYLLFSLEM